MLKLNCTYTLFLLAFAFSSCTYFFNRNLAKSTKKVEQIIFAKESKKQVVTITWAQAVKLALKRNYEYLEAVERWREAKRKRKYWWQHWVPKLNLVATVSKNLDQIDRISTRDLNFNSFLPISLPSPIREPVRLYRLLYEERKLRYQLEENKRDLYLQLDRFFYQQQQQVKKKLPPRSLAEVLRQRKDTVTKKQQKENLQIDLAKFFNLRDKVIFLKGSTPRAKINPAEYQFGKNFGTLGIQLAALELSAIRFKKLQNKVQQFPDINLNTSSYTVATFKRNQGSLFNRSDIVNNIRLGVSFYKSFDFVGDRRREKKRFNKLQRRSKQLLIEQIKQEQLKWQRAQSKYAELLQQSTFLQKKIMAIENGMHTYKYNVIDKIKERANFIEQKKATVLEMIKVQREAWKWADNQW